MEYSELSAYLLERKGEGGLRTRGYFKKTNDSKSLISIITVVYNGEKDIEQTIYNVINQTYDNIEYIIIDGGSSDGTLDIIKKYEDKIDYWISEKDNGIYDAMNKGISLVKGNWINFMNAGDTFYNFSLLESIFQNNNFENFDVIYGDHKVIYPHKTRIAMAGSIKKIWMGSQFCHQSTFISSSFHKKNKYNLCNKIGADFEFFYKAYQNKAIFQYIGIVVTNYAAGGISDMNRIDSIVSRWNIVEKNNRVNFYYIWIIIKEIVKSYIKNFLSEIRVVF